ncbi:hypothetical protein [Lachnospira pectinoschiza]|uniref:Uncharacterized protein n=1 Tax=Lachnospira pectinoschiza TaxID=28052 RepID=A0A1G9YUE1_9FIRM|nr:hypothetical protein [Lachnospira pectinoschiza]SDN12704.1 hypothetical protein SAMN05216544_1940 [Lachnospira pectinoschiza]
MSRVTKPGNKYMNATKYDSAVTGPSKKVRIHCEGEDYHKAKTIAQWLFVKYDMSYKTYRNKSKNRRDEMRAEFEADTGVSLKKREAERIQRHLNNLDFDDNWDSEYENAMELLESIGVPFSPDGTPLGIGWDD